MKKPGDLDAYLGKAALASLVGLIFQPSIYCVRTIEQLDLTVEPVTRKTAKEYKIDTPRVLVPIAFPRRKELITSLSIEESRGVTPYVLGRQDTILVMTWILLATAKATRLPGINRGAVDEVCELVPVATEVTQAMDLISDFRRLLVASNGGSSLTPEQVGLMTALQFFARRQPLLVPCRPAESRLKITFLRDVTQLEMQHRGFVEGSRSALGRAPDHLRFDAPLATRSQSYHFRLRAPSDFYIRDIHCLRRLRSEVPHDVRQMWPSYGPVPATSGAILGDGANPTELAHIQLVNASELAEARHGLVIIVRISERPLGRTGSALIRLTVVVLGCFMLPLFGSQLVVSGTATVSAVLLGLPGLLGASLLVNRLHGPIREPVLARFGNIAAVATSVALSLILSVWVIDYSQYRLNHTLTKALSGYAIPTGVANAFYVLQVLSTSILCLVFTMLVQNVVLYWQAQRRYRQARRS